MHASLIFNGSAVRTRGSLGIVKMTRNRADAGLNPRRGAVTVGGATAESL